MKCPRCGYEMEVESIEDCESECGAYERHWVCQRCEYECGDIVY